MAKLGEMSAASSTKRRYISSWSAFYRYARKRVPLGEDPSKTRTGSRRITTPDRRTRP